MGIMFRVCKITKPPPTLGSNEGLMDSAVDHRELGRGFSVEVRLANVLKLIFYIEDIIKYISEQEG